MGTRAVLKITTLNNQGIFRWAADPSEWEKNNEWETVLLFKGSDGFSGEVMNNIRKAYGIARRSWSYGDLFDPEFVAACLIIANMRACPVSNNWFQINKRPIDMAYSYLLKIDFDQKKWRVDGSCHSEGAFFLDEWKVSMHPDHLKYNYDRKNISARYVRRFK